MNPLKPIISMYVCMYVQPLILYLVTEISMHFDTFSNSSRDIFRSLSVSASFNVLLTMDLSWAQKIDSTDNGWLNKGAATIETCSGTYNFLSWIAWDLYKAYVYVRICTYIRAYMHVCTYVYTHKHMYMHDTNIRTYIHTYVRTRMYVHMSIVMRIQHTYWEYCVSNETSWN